MLCKGRLLLICSKHLDLPKDVEYELAKFSEVFFDRNIYHEPFEIIPWFQFLLSRFIDEYAERVNLCYL